MGTYILDVGLLMVDWSNLKLQKLLFLGLFKIKLSVK